MLVKKIRNAPYHLANKLHGTRQPATYGVFDHAGNQVGVVRKDWSWNAYRMDLRTSIIGHSVSTLAELKAKLAAK